jgi:uncharacterized membrane protein
MKKSKRGTGLSLEAMVGIMALMILIIFLIFIFIKIYTRVPSA